MSKNFLMNQKIYKKQILILKKFIFFIIILSCNNSQKPILSKKNINIKQKDTGNINSNLYSSINKTKDFYTEKLKEKIKILENKYDSSSTKEKAELALKKSKLKKLNKLSNDLKKCFNNLNKDKNHQKVSKLKNISFFKTFCDNYQKLKSNNKKKSLLITKYNSIEDYLDKILESNDDDELVWNSFIDENLTQNFNNFFDAYKETLNQSNCFNKRNLNNSLINSQKLINCYLEIIKDTDIKNEIIDSVYQKNSKTKFVSTIDIAENMFYEEIIKPLKKSYLSLSKKEKYEKLDDYEKLLKEFHEYKQMVKQYKKVDPLGKELKNFIEIYKKEELNNDLSESIFSTIIFLVNLKDFLQILFNKSSKNFFLHNDELWKQKIKNMTNYIKTIKRIEQLKNIVKNIKIKTKKLNNSKLKLILNINEKELSLAYTFLGFVKNNRLIVVKSYI